MARVAEPESLPGYLHKRAALAALLDASARNLRLLRRIARKAFPLLAGTLKGISDGHAERRLNIATGALNADQAALDVVSNNVANANTPGYTRQVATFKKIIPSPSMARATEPA